MYLRGALDSAQFLSYEKSNYLVLRCNRKT
jgi:hypothetical protein